MAKITYGDKVQWFDELLDEWVEGVVVKGVYNVYPIVTVKRYDNDEYDTIDTRFAQRLK